MCAVRVCACYLCRRTNETSGNFCRGLLPAALAITRCLVADGDPELLQSVADYLRRFGFEVAAAASAAQMRSGLWQGGVDVVILDVMLPDGDGLAICAALRQRLETANLPVIMLTSPACARSLGKPILPCAHFAAGEVEFVQTDIPICSDTT